MSSSSSDDAIANDALQLIAKIEPLLAGHTPIVQGAVLCDLATTWIRGHHPMRFRRAIFKAHVDAIRRQIDDDDGETRQ